MKLIWYKTTNLQALRLPVYDATFTVTFTILLHARWRIRPYDATVHQGMKLHCTVSGNEPCLIIVYSSV